MAVSIQSPNEPPGLSPEIMQQLVKGDISGLTAKQKVEYYLVLCERLGLDPATQPFAFLVLSGKEVLYASKSCAEQLRKRHAISIDDVEGRELRDIYVVKATARLPNGRTDTSTGAVSIGNLKGDALANAIMKTETKAKRRVTLSICGLGMLDETEIETIPGARIVPVSEIETTLLPPEEAPPSPPPKGDNRNIRIHTLLREIAKINPDYHIDEWTAKELADRKNSKRRYEFYERFFKHNRLSKFTEGEVDTLELALKRRKADAKKEQNGNIRP